MRYIAFVLCLLTSLSVLADMSGVIVRVIDGDIVLIQGKTS